ncbi:hypothetical protein [Pseudomonas sp. StFLB209]|uniref:hypothetical protein n=1 Tax=Pseudomonas sp. StFLB209 TaxID=1028989 RepID=UPI001186781C|nr:hypothetical protein [Pseudomonas sp. StFLB209]
MVEKRSAGRLLTRYHNSPPAESLAFDYIRVAKGLHALANNCYLPASVMSLYLDPTTGEQDARQDQGGSTVKGYCRQGVGMVWDKKPASAGFLLPAEKCLKQSGTPPPSLIIPPDAIKNCPQRLFR